MRIFNFLYPWIVWLVLVSLSGCEVKEPKDEDGGLVWLVDTNEVMGQVDESFPFISQPAYQSAEHVAYDSAALVLAVRAGGQTYVYPNDRMRVEVVNEEFNEHPVAVTYCPITGSGLLWDRIYNEDTLAFRASGMLYRENLMPVDTAGGSIWSQMLMLCVHGNYAGTWARNLQLIETNWNTIREHYPGAHVFTLDKNSQGSTFPASYGVRSTLHPSGEGPLPEEGDKVSGMVGLKEVVLFPYNLFSSGPRIIHMGHILVIGDEKERWVSMFEHPGDLSFTPVSDGSSAVMIDNQGSRWDMFGYAIDGPNKGQQLVSPDFYVAKYWAWKSFYDNLRVYGSSSE